MIFNYEQQKLYGQRFIRNLSVERNLSSHTLKAYQYDLNRFFQWCDEHRITTLDGQSVFAYFLYLQNEIQLKPKSIRRKYVSLGQYFHFLKLEYGIHEVFFRFTSRKFQVPHNLPKTLSKSEIRALIAATSNAYQNASTDFRRWSSIRDMCIIELLFCLGLRIGEIEALNLDDYSREDCSVLIHGKGSKERMLFISSPIVCQKMNLWLQQRTYITTSESAFFINKYGTRLSIYGIEKIFYKYRQLAGINPQATPHYLRHSFATQLLNNGANIRDVQELMGHNSIVTTQIYTEISLNRKKEVLMRYNGRDFL